MEVAFGAPNLGQTPSSPSISHRQGAWGPPAPHKKHSIPRNASGPAVQNCCSNTENQPGATSRPRRPNQSPKRRVPIPRNDAQQRCRAGDPQQEKTEPLWRSTDHLPSRKKGEHLALGGWRGIFFLFFPPFFSCQSPQLPTTGPDKVASPGHAAGSPQRPVHSLPLRSTPPNPRCQQILPQPDTSLDPLPVTSSSTLHLSS